MIVDGQDLLLVGGELAVGPLQRHQYGVGGALEADGCGALLHGLHCVLYLNVKWFRAVFRFILMRIQIRGSASGMMDPGPELDPDPT